MDILILKIWYYRCGVVGQSIEFKGNGKGVGVTIV